MTIKAFVLLKILLRFTQFAQNRLELERIVSHCAWGLVMAIAFGYNMVGIYVCLVSAQTHSIRKGIISPVSRSISAIEYSRHCIKYMGTVGVG